MAMQVICEICRKRTAQELYFLVLLLACAVQILRKKIVHSVEQRILIAL